MQRKLKLLGSFLIFFLIALLVGEFVARFFIGLGTPPLSITHPKIEYMFKPNQSVSRFGNTITINQFGMRSDQFPANKANDEIRIMAFGDSVLNGGNLTDHKDLATTRLQTLLNRKHKVTVGNISAGSWGPGNWLAYADIYGFFDADIVVLIASSGDIVDSPTFRRLDPNTHPTIEPVLAIGEAISRYLPRYLPKLKTDETSNETDDLKNNKDERKKRCRKDLRKFLHLAQENSSFFLVLQHMERSEIEKNQPRPGHFEIKALCRDLGINYASMELYFRDALENRSNPYRDNIHPNILGQKLITQALLDNLPEKFFPDCAKGSTNNYEYQNDKNNN